MRKNRPTLGRNVLVFGLVSFFTDVSSEMTTKVLPLFLANVLGVKAEIIGLIEGIADSTATLLKLVSGWISDRVGRRKPLVVAGYSLSVLSKPLLYFASTWPFVLVLRFVERVGKGIRTSPRDALLADSAPTEHQGRAFGFNRAMDTLGAVLGLLIAAAVVALGSRGLVQMTRGTFQTLVLVAMIPAFLSITLLAALVRDPGKAGTGKRLVLSARGFDSRFFAFLGIVVLFTLGNSSDAFLVLRAQQMGMPLVQIFLMLALFNLVASAAAYPLGALSDRLGRQKVIAAGWVIYGLIYLGFAVAGAAWQVWTLFAVYGLYYGATDGVARALVSDIVPPEKRGTAYGLYNAAVGISALPASLIAGVLWQRVSPSAPFLFGAGMAIAAVVGMVLFLRPAKAARG